MYIGSVTTGVPTAVARPLTSPSITPLGSMVSLRTGNSRLVATKARTASDKSTPSELWARTSSASMLEAAVLVPPDTASGAGSPRGLPRPAPRTPRKRSAWAAPPLPDWYLQMALPSTTSPMFRKLLSSSWYVFAFATGTLTDLMC